MNENSKAWNEDSIGDFNNVCTPKPIMNRGRGHNKRGAFKKFQILIVIRIYKKQRLYMSVFMTC